MPRNVLEHVRDELLNCRAISSTREFCQSWLAKDESYLRVLRHNKLQPSADALATCASKLGYYAKHLGRSEKPESRAWSELFARLRGQCLQAMDDQARSKWMTPERMGL